jgi:hypothetical protein
MCIGGPRRDCFGMNLALSVGQRRSINMRVGRDEIIPARPKDKPHTTLPYSTLARIISEGVFCGLFPDRT